MWEHQSSKGQRNRQYWYPRTWLAAVELESSEGWVIHLHHDQKTCALTARGWQQEYCLQCAMPPSAVPPVQRYPKGGTVDHGQYPCWRFIENGAFADEKFCIANNIHCLPFRVQFQDNLWTASAWDWLLQSICFEVFLAACMTYFDFPGIKCWQKLPAIQTALLMSHWCTPWLWANTELSQCCLLKSRAMSYALLIMKKWTWMELYPESKLLNKYALMSDSKKKTCLWEQLPFHQGQPWLIPCFIKCRKSPWQSTTLWRLLGWGWLFSFSDITGVSRLLRYTVFLFLPVRCCCCQPLPLLQVWLDPAS